MYKSYKFRLYPSDDQKLIINKHFGCTRFIYNYFLSECKNKGYIKTYDMINKLPNLIIEYPFLKEVDNYSLKNSIYNLEDSYKKYFSKRTKYPKYKNKFSKQSYKLNFVKNNFIGTDLCNVEMDLKNHKIKLPKLGIVNIKGYSNLEKVNGKIINVTIEKETTDKYYAILLVSSKDEIKKQIIPTNIVGIDLGIKDLVVTSDGCKYENPKEIEKREKNIKRLQRKLSRQVKYSKNYYKTKHKISVVYSKIKNSRKQNIINIVNEIVNNNDIIVSENLKVKEMSKNNNLSKYIFDASFNKICESLKNKANKEGKYYYQVDTYYPSSKICNHCGNKTNVTNNLSIRKWKCLECENENDRDINASINIMFEGIKMHYNNCVNK